MQTYTAVGRLQHLNPSTAPAAPRKAAGFTLIELMIAVAVVGLLVAIAYPSYTKQITRGQRTAGQDFAMDVAQREEQYILDNVGAGLYTQSLAALGYATLPPEVAPYYQAPVFTISVTPPATYSIALTPVAGSRLAQVNDGTLYVNSAGQRFRSIQGTGNYNPATDCTFEDGTCVPH
jgi:type IV pilus assembly protein PilE